MLGQCTFSGRMMRSSPLFTPLHHHPLSYLTLSLNRVASMVFESSSSISSTVLRRGGGFLHAAEHGPPHVIPDSRLPPPLFQEQRQHHAAAECRRERQPNPFIRRHPLHSPASVNAGST